MSKLKHESTYLLQNCYLSKIKICYASKESWKNIFFVNMSIKNPGFRWREGGGCQNFADMSVKKRFLLLTPVLNVHTSKRPKVVPFFSSFLIKAIGVASSIWLDYLIIKVIMQFFNMVRAERRTNYLKGIICSKER